MTREWNHNHISMPMLRPVTPKPMSEFDGVQGILSNVSPAKKKARFRCWWPDCHTTKLYAVRPAWAKHATSEQNAHPGGIEMGAGAHASGIEIMGNPLRRSL